MGKLESVSCTHVDRLCKLGLTTLQAKIYLLLYETGRTKIQALARIANVDRANTYQILRQLQEKGVVETTVGKPILYQAVPLQEATAALLAQKKREFEKVVETSKELLQETAEHEQKLLDLSMPQISFVSFGESSARKKIDLAWTNVQILAELYLEKPLFAESLERPWVGNMWKEAMNRGVKVRVITQNLQQKSACFIDSLSSLEENKNFEIRYTASPIICQFICLDGKETWLFVEKINGFGQEQSIMLRHKGLGKMAHTFFGMLWDQTLPALRNEQRTLSRSTKPLVSTKAPKKINLLKEKNGILKEISST